MQIVLTNNTTNFSKIYMDVEDTSNNPLFYCFEIDTEELVDGEYLVKVYDDNNYELTSNILKIGEFNNTKQTYNIEKKYKRKT
jgi:hypothetical protein